MHAAFVTRGHVMIPLGFRPCLQAVPTARAMQYTQTCLRMVYMALMRSSSWTSMFMVMLYTNIDMTPYNHQWLPRLIHKVHYVAPIQIWDASPCSRARGFGRDTFVAGSSSSFEYRHASAWPIRYKGSAYWGSSRSILAFYMYVNPVL